MVQQLSDSSKQTLALCAGAGACFFAGWTAHAAFSSRWRPTVHPDGDGKRQAAQSLPTHLAGGDASSVSPSAASTPREGHSYPPSMADHNGHKMALLVRADLDLVSKADSVISIHEACCGNTRQNRSYSTANIDTACVSCLRSFEAQIAAGSIDCERGNALPALGVQGKGRTAVLCSHAAVQQYKKVT